MTSIVLFIALAKDQTMLHKVNLPSCQSDMQKLLDFQRRVLQFALNASLPYARSDFESKFGTTIGRWFWGRTRRGSKMTAFGTKLNAVISFAQAHSGDVAIVYGVLVNDMEFPDQFAKLTFKFLFPELSPDWQDVLKPFLISFYEQFGKETGFPQAIFSWITGDITRKNLMAIYRNDNNQVCPYCDAAGGDFTDSIDANDADHLFPKDIYSPLAVHWANLVRACMVCNERFKLAKDPIDPHGPGELDTIYHPIYAPAIPNGARVSVRPSSINPNEYVLKLEDPTHPQRAVNLDRILELNGRWTNRIKCKLQSNKSALVADVIESLKEESIMVDDELVERHLGVQARERRKKIGIQADMVCEVAVLEYQATSPDEIFAITKIHT
jgi:hypothetical protein